MKLNLVVVVTERKRVIVENITLDDVVGSVHYERAKKQFMMCCPDHVEAIDSMFTEIEKSDVLLEAEYQNKYYWYKLTRIT